MSITNYCKVVLLHREMLPRLVLPSLTELVSGGDFAAAGLFELSEFAYSGVRILAERFYFIGNFGEISYETKKRARAKPGAR